VTSSAPEEPAVVLRVTFARLTMRISPLSIIRRNWSGPASSKFVYSVGSARKAPPFCIRAIASPAYAGDSARIRSPEATNLLVGHRPATAARTPCRQGARMSEGWRSAVLQWSKALRTHAHPAPTRRHIFLKASMRPEAAAGSCPTHPLQGVPERRVHLAVEVRVCLPVPRIVR